MSAIDVVEKLAARADALRSEVAAARMSLAAKESELSKVERQLAAIAKAVKANSKVESGAARIRSWARDRKDPFRASDIIAAVGVSAAGARMEIRGMVDRGEARWVSAGLYEVVR